MSKARQQATLPIGPRKEPPAVRRRQTILTVLILALALWVGRSFLTPLLWAVVLAVSLWPLHQRALRRAPRHPWLSALGLTLLTGLLLMLPLSVAVLAAAGESETALAWARQAQATGLAVPAWLPHFPFLGPRLAEIWQQHLGTPQAARQLLGSLDTAQVLSWTTRIAGEVASGSMLFLITLAALFALLSKGKAFGRDVRRASGRLLGDFGLLFVERLTAAVRSTVFGTVLVSIGEGTLIGIGYVAAGVPRPVLFTMLTIVFAMIPFGAWLMFGIAALILIVQDHLLAGLLLFGFSVVVMTVGDNVVQPAVIGNAARLPFLLALVGTFGGLATFGLVGLFLGPAVMAALLLLWQQWLAAPHEADEPD
jgi:predicted PurR-regulated permease PerM